jgi:hypothetical protein
MTSTFSRSAVLWLLISIVSAPISSAATLTAADVSPTEVTALSQAATAGITTLDSLAKANADLVQARQGELARIAKAVSDLTNAKLLLGALKLLLDRHPEFVAARAARDRAQAVLENAPKINVNLAQTDAEANDQAKATEALAALILSELSRIAVELDPAKLNAIAGAIAKGGEADMTAIAQELQEINKEKEILRDRIIAQQEAIAGKEAAAAAAAEAAKAAAALKPISSDRSKAAALLAAILNNRGNPVGLSPALRSITGVAEVDVREVREADGLIVLFRLGRLEHCLSTRLQCGRKQYSVK